MQIKEISIYVLAFSFAIAAINSLGIFSPVQTIDTDAVNQTMVNGISEINDSAASENDVASAVSGTSLLLQTWGIVLTMLSLTLVPGVYLYHLGVPVAFCLAIQGIVNVTEIWGIVQWLTGRSAKTID